MKVEIRPFRFSPMNRSFEEEHVLARRVAMSHKFSNAEIDRILFPSISLFVGISSFNASDSSLNGGATFEYVFATPKRRLLTEMVSGETWNSFRRSGAFEGLRY